MKVTREALFTKGEECGVPLHCLPSLINYILDGVPTGDFLRSLLSNDLRMTFMHADRTNRHSVNAYIAFLFNHCPADCWGSKENYDEWIQRRGLSSSQQCPTNWQ